MKKVLISFLTFLSLMVSINAFAMGFAMTQDEIEARESKARADIQATEARKKVNIQANKDSKLASIDAKEAEKKNQALAEQKMAEAEKQI